MQMKIESTPTFRRDYKRLFKKHYKMEKLDKVIEYLANKDTEILKSKYRDHALKGPLKKYRELHIESDWLLMYEIKENELVLLLVTTGSHDYVLKPR